MKQMINRIREKIKNSQLGSATIEAVVAFTGFLFVIFTILNIVNVCRAQMLVSNAVDTVTKELTQYSYFYEISGLQKFENKLQAISDNGDLDLNTIASSVGNLYTALANGASSSEAEMRGLANSLQEGTLSSTSINTALQNVDTQKNEVLAAMESMEAQMEGLPDNPVVYLKSIVAVAGSQGLDMLKSHAIAAPLAKSLMVKHFGDNRAEANATLERLGVVDGLSGMNFNMSTIFQKDHQDEIHLAVYYKVKVVQLFKWADFEATICKETRARAWLGGDDVQYRVVSAISDSGSSSSGETGGSGEASSEEGDDEGGVEEDEDSDSHTGDTGLENYLASVEPEIIDAIQRENDTTGWTEAQWCEAINTIVFPIVPIVPTATPAPTEVPQSTATPVPTITPEPTISPEPTIVPDIDKEENDKNSNGVVIVKEGDHYIDYKNEAGSIIRIPIQHPNTIDSKIDSCLNSNNVGNALEAQVADYIRNNTEEQIVHFGNKVTDNKKNPLGDIDVETTTYFIEVKASISDVNTEQLEKYVDDTHTKYMNVEGKEVIVYIDQDVDMTNSKNVATLEKMEKMGIRVIIGMEELEKEVK